MPVVKTQVKFNSGDWEFRNNAGSAIARLRSGTGERELDIPSGATIDINGTFQIAGVTVTVSAAQLNALGGVTLDGAYDQGGAGAGRTINAHDGAVVIQSTDADNNNVLEITKNPVGAQSGAGISVTMGAQATGAGISFANTGSGNDLLGSGSTWSVSKAGVGTFDSLSVGQVTLTEDVLPAGTSAYIGRDNTGDVTVNALTGKAVHLAVNGVDVLDVAGAGVTITGTLTVSGAHTFNGVVTFNGLATLGAGADLNGTELILDADGDSSLTADTDDRLDIKLNAADEYAFSAAAVDLNSNHLDNAGYLILNAVTLPAGTEVYVGHDNVGDATVNALVGKTVNIAIANVDVAQFAAASVTFPATVNIAGFATGAITINSGAADVDFSIAGDNNANAIVLDAGTDSLALGRAVIAGAFLSIDGVTVNRAGVTSVGRGVHVPAGTYTQTNGDPTTLAVAASVFLGTPTFAGANPNQTISLSSTLYIQGPATQGANMTMAAGTVYSLYIAAGNAYIAGSLGLGAGFTMVNDAIATFGTGGDIAIVERSTILNANTTLAGVIIGTPVVTATPADSLIVSNLTAGGDIVFALNDGAGNSWEYLRLDASGVVTIGTTTTTDINFSVAVTGNANGLIVDWGLGTVGIGAAATGSATLTIGGSVAMNGAAYDLLIKAATAASWELSDGTTKFYAVDTRVVTAGVTTHSFDISDYTIASAAGNVVTGWNLLAHTLNYTGNTQVTTEVDTVVIGARTIAGDTATLTVDEANSVLLVAPTEGANVAITAASALRIVNAGGTPVNQYGIYIEDLTVGATADYGIYIAGADTAAIYVASGDPIHLGVAGASTGKLEMDGATSGTLTIVPNAATTSWTITMPATANTNAGYQLTCAGADSITSWAAAASVREAKDIRGLHAPQDALDKILGTKVYDFRYKAGMGTQDAETDYVGLIADEAPWAMHYGGGVVNPINALGYTVLAFQAMAAEIKALRDEVAALKSKGS